MSKTQLIAPALREAQAAGAGAIEALREIGAELCDDFTCTGLPQLSLHDLTKKGDTPLDLEDFRGRLVLGAPMNSSDIGPFPAGPVRISLLKWGPGPEQVGRIVVGRSELDATSIVSYISVSIGDHVILEPRVVIMDCDGHPADRRLPDIPENKKMAPVVIEDHAFIGHDSLIMKGVTIGHHAVVGPHSVVMWNVPPNCVVQGNPAKKIADYREVDPGQEPK